MLFFGLATVELEKRRQDGKEKVALGSLWECGGTLEHTHTHMHTQEKGGGSETSLSWLSPSRFAPVSISRCIA